MKPVGTRSLLLLPVVLITAAAVIGVYVGEGGTPGADPVGQGPACRDYALFSDEVSAEKLEPLRLDCEAVKAKLDAAGGTLPSPVIVTPSPSTPGPVVSCSQWDPSTGGGCVHYGILEGRQPPPGYEDVVLVTNHWAGTNRLVYAGSLKNDPGQGIVVVVERFGSGRNLPLGEFKSTNGQGALRILNADGNRLDLVTTGGSEYTFDVDAMTLTPK